MAEEGEPQSAQEVAAVEAEAAREEASAGQSPWQAHEAAGEGGPAPEVLAGAAFVGGFALAKLLKRLGGDDD